MRMALRRSEGADGERQPEYQAPFRGAWVQVWRGEALLRERVNPPKSDAGVPPVDQRA